MLRKLVLTLFTLFFFSDTVLAAVTYTYQGNAFDGFSTPPGSYSTSNMITGSFTLAAPLAPNLPASNIRSQVLSYSFSDGVNTFNDINSVICGWSVMTFLVGTDANGDINTWGIDLCTPVSKVNDPFNNVTTISGLLSVFADTGISSATCTTVTNGLCTEVNIFNATSGYNEDNPGTWTTHRQIALSVPTMTQWGMMIFIVFGGLGAIYFLRRKRRA
jgi:hypothetical protein